MPVLCSLWRGEALATTQESRPTLTQWRVAISAFQTDKSLTSMNTRTKSLANDLCSLDKRRRESALDRIRILPKKTAIDTLIELMEMGTTQRTSLWARLIPIVLVTPSCLYLLLFAGESRLHRFSGLAMAWTLIVANGSSFWLTRQVSQVNLWVTPLLSEYSDARLLTPCLKEWKSSKGEKRVNLLNGLVQNLPLLTPEVAAGMTTENCKQLRELVRVESPDLQRVTLAALLCIEDTGAIPYVEAFLKKKRSNPLQEAGEVCLSGLLELKRRENDREVLLRASVEENGKEILLRPATSHSDEDEQQLLRPGDKGE